MARLTNRTQTVRSAGGRFVKGTAPGPGNPHAALVGKLRARLYKVIKAKDVDAAIATIRDIMADGKGKAADRLTAAKLLLDRAIGDPSHVLEMFLRTESGPTISDYTQALLADPEAIAAHKRISELLIGGRGPPEPVADA
jgi:hypothetical protein